jgi:hypothetical protein
LSLLLPCPAASARVTIHALEGLVQQLQLKHLQQEDQLVQQNQRIERQQEQLQQQGQQILRNERELLQQRLRMEQKDTELQIKEHQLQQAEGVLRELRAQGQQQELQQWRQLATYTSLDEQELRQQQEVLQQDREELGVLEQQLHCKQEELELLQQQVSRQQEQQQEQLAQVRAEAQELQQQQETLRQEQRQLEHQQQESLLLRTQLKQQQQEALQAQAAEIEHQQVLLLASRPRQYRTVSASTSMQGFSLFPHLQETMPMPTPMPAQASTGQEQQPAAAAALPANTLAQGAAAAGLPLALQTAAVQQEPPAARTHDVPRLALHKAGPPQPQLLQQVAQTLASPSSSHAGFAQVPMGSVGSAAASALAQPDLKHSGQSGGSSALSSRLQAPHTPSAAECGSSHVQSCQQEQGQGQEKLQMQQHGREQEQEEVQVQQLQEVVHEQAQEQEQEQAQEQRQGQVQGQADEQQPQEPVQEQQQKPCVPLLPTWDAAHQDSSNWQVIPSPSSFAPADMQQYHASAFNSVLQHLTPGDSVDVTSAAAAAAGGSAKQQQQQQRDLVLVAEYMQALAADNTVLSCEVLHLQQLLVQQRRSASSSAEAVAKKVAAEAVKLAVQLQQWELRREVQQAAADAAALSHISCVSSSEGTESHSDSGSADTVVSADEAHKLDFICGIVRGKLSGLLAAHEARLQVSGLCKRCIHAV